VTEKSVRVPQSAVEQCSIATPTIVGGVPIRDRVLCRLYLTLSKDELAAIRKEAVEIKHSPSKTYEYWVGKGKCYAYQYGNFRYYTKREIFQKRISPPRTSRVYKDGLFSGASYKFKFVLDHKSHSEQKLLQNQTYFTMQNIICTGEYILSNMDKDVYQLVPVLRTAIEQIKPFAIGIAKWAKSFEVSFRILNGFNKKKSKTSSVV